VQGSREDQTRPELATVGCWPDAIAFLRAVSAREYAVAGNLLDDAAAREGMGDVNGALADVGRALLDLVEFDAGTIDVLSVVESLSERALELAGTTHCDDTSRLRALIVFLGSEGLPCAARSEVASWSPLDRRAALVTFVTGIAAWVARDRCSTLDAVIDALEPPASPAAAFGTFGLTVRSEHDDPSPFLGALPSGCAPRITFLGAGRCNLRSIFARVAYLREPHPGGEMPRQRMDAHDLGIAG
jgi:hypothetical protein